MSEQIENFIKKHKNEFDVHEPAGDLWSKLDQKLDEHCQKEKKRSKMSLVFMATKIAAVFLLVLSFGFIWGYYKNEKANNLSYINPEYAAKEVRFSSMIEDKRTELKDLKNVDPALYKTFIKEQDKLEKEYASLKKELSTTPNQDKIVKAMIRNLQSQISLLNQQINITNEVKQIKSDQNETLI